MVRRVMNRLLPHVTHVSPNIEFKIQVIDAPDDINSFVLSGGKVFVFSGILPICEDEDGVAAVLGHETAHSMAHHTSEKMTRMAILYAGAYLLELFGGVPRDILGALGNLAFGLPNGRMQKGEADYIGLLLMAQSCYDPQAAVDLWERLAKQEQFQPPELLSTHPSSENRMETLRGLLPEAMQKREDSECYKTIGYADDFKIAYREVGVFDG